MRLYWMRAYSKEGGAAHSIRYNLFQLEDEAKSTTRKN